MRRSRFSGIESLQVDMRDSKTAGVCNCCFGSYSQAVHEDGGNHSLYDKLPIFALGDIDWLMRGLKYKLGPG